MEKNYKSLLRVIEESSIYKEIYMSVGEWKGPLFKWQLFPNYSINSIQVQSKCKQLFHGTKQFDPKVHGKDRR